jgi:hypothetical protein
MHGPWIEKTSAGKDVTGGRLARRGDDSRESIYMPEKSFLRKKEVVEDLLKLKDVAGEGKGIRRVVSLK